jgi:hypothetical protein
MELPPESELREPMRPSREPSAPARAIPYIGLCGLLPVSFSDRAGITAPLMLVAVPAPNLEVMPKEYPK